MRYQYLVLIFVLVLSVALLCYAQTAAKPGYVYVLSNVGSFGEGVYKVGMTQREKPLDRVRELGDASVPFPFDVHVMIATNDPRGLERKIQNDLNEFRVNKINTKKEFFRTDLDTIVSIIEKHNGKPFDVTHDVKSTEFQRSL